jgi:hypothetical protein
MKNNNYANPFGANPGEMNDMAANLVKEYAFGKVR